MGIPTARNGSCVTWLPPLVGAGFVNFEITLEIDETRSDYGIKGH
jgi:hypothetical protein